MAFLRDEVFRQVVEATPLVSLDLIVRDTQGRLLLGRRRNRPARNAWFVPGGRILKNEHLDDAFLRLTQQELDWPVQRREAMLLGVYEHLYPDSIFGEKTETHYVVLAHLIDCPDDTRVGCSLEQHDVYRWCSLAEAAADPEVHPYTKDYFPALERLSCAGSANPLPLGA